MRIRILPGASLLLALAIVLMGCPERPAPAPDDPTVDQAQVQEFQSEMESRLGQVESDIAQLEQRAAEVPEDDRDAHQREAEDLRNDLQDVRQRLQEPTPETHREWTSHRDGVLGDVHDLENRAEQRLISSSQNTDQLESTTRERLQRLDQRRQEVAAVDDPALPWLQSYEEARQDVQERLAELPQLGEDDFESARSDIAGSIETMRARLHDGELDEWQRRDREAADRTDPATDPDWQATEPAPADPAVPGAPADPADPTDPDYQDQEVDDPPTGA